MASAVSLLLIYVSQAVTISLIIICNTASSTHGTNSLFNSLNTKDLNKCPQDKQWFCFSSTTRAYSCDQAAVSGRITCSDDGPIMDIGSCDENTQVLSISKCLNQVEISDYNRSPWGMSLPTVLIELNDYRTYLDTLILFNLAVMCFVSTLRKQKFPMLQILLSTPIIAFIVVILHRKVVCACAI